MSRQAEEDALTKYYLNQVGYGSSEIYRGQLYQKGKVFFLFCLRPR